MAAAFSHAGGDTAARLAAVEPVPAIRRDRLQRSRQVGLAQQRTRRGRAVLQERLATAGVGGEHVLHRPDQLRQGGWNREAVARKRHRGRQQLGERLRAQPAVQRAPGVDEARHGDRSAASQRNAVWVSLRRRGGGCAAARVQGQRLARGGADQRETVAAQVAGVGLDDGHHRRHRDRRVDGVAAGAQRIDAGQRGELVGAGNDAATAGDRAAHGRLQLRPGCLSRQRQRVDEKGRIR
ncbi:MAG: hypothetical protein IIB87_04500 [Chloroflexi bacterium]|nr:hypothetical protein [Chloroflexota bacterium]